MTSINLKGGDFDDHLMRSKKAAGYLRLLNHSKKCRGACGQATCRHTHRLLQHTIDCKPVGFICQIKGCGSTKKLLAHVLECTDKKKMCLVCTLASTPARRSSVGGEYRMDTDSRLPDMRTEEHQKSRRNSGSYGGIDRDKDYDSFSANNSNNDYGD
eukprot:CAMPEP_0119046232 /NCGR_PEP_ID=MMETSP1177-20130426/45266_1 /TAXON_ID=2985 /ORGANISM="Ochromonas sp, Strain CCMP1899" /LENGTH=156 /DNA_ID=CAMNT_0007019103 /DNA_START=148 /DNA_END=615 /DNA_ORIENTATION=-